MLKKEKIDISIKKKLKGLELSLSKKQLQTLLKDFNGADIDTMFNLAVQFSDTIKINHESQHYWRRRTRGFLRCICSAVRWDCL